MYTRIASLLVLASAAPFAQAAGLPSGAYTSHEYTLTFADHGKLTLLEKDKNVLDGTWSSKDGSVTITDVSGSYACAAPNQTGVYAWKSVGDGIAFTKQKDACDDRARALDGETWKRKS
jgi:hypothetical protein